MITPWLIISLMFAAGGLVTSLLGRRLAGKHALAWLLRAVGLLLLLMGIVGIGSEYL